MTFKSRLALTSAVAVAVAVAVVSCAIFLGLRALLHGQVDEDLRRLAREAVVRDQRGNFAIVLPPDPLGGPRGYGQLVSGDGSPAASLAVPGIETPSILPASERATEVARGAAPAYFTDVEVGGTHVRVYTRRISGSPPTAIQVARPVDDVDLALRRFAFVLVAVALGGIGLAAGLGGVVARAALVPLRRIMVTAEAITESGDPRHRIDVGGDDEVGRLAKTLNRTLEALDQSLETQRQLIADASHELRTPLTSLKTNLEILRDVHRLPDTDRERVIRSLATQVDELTGLVSDVVELARGNQPSAPMEDVRLDLLAVDVVERARARFPGARLDLDASPSSIRAVPARVDRAITNLVNNAVMWSPGGGPVTVTVDDGEISVRDRGPGVPEGEREKIFERFYRAPSARGKPGSGLGLAIVKQVAESHGASVWVESDGDGALFRMRFPKEPLADLHRHFTVAHDDERVPPTRNEGELDAAQANVMDRRDRLARDDRDRMR